MRSPTVHDAHMRFFMNADLSGTIAQVYSVKIEGRCDESYFSVTQTLWHSTHAFHFLIPNCKLWWPKHAGTPALYDITVTLMHGDAICDTYKLKAGIRTVELDRTDATDLDGNGESNIDSGCGFLDHMLTLFAKHGGFDLTLTCDGDTYVDDHHTVEDIGIALGSAFTQALGDRISDSSIPRHLPRRYPPIR